jgi:hypothetical protein
MKGGKYKSGNRVGTIDIHSHPDHDGIFGNNEPVSSTMSSQYHRNLMSQEKSFTVVESETTRQSQGHKYQEIESPQAINKELINTMQQNERFDSGSIGSFLSMASMRSFPRYLLMGLFIFDGTWC